MSALPSTSPSASGAGDVAAPSEKQQHSSSDIAAATDTLPALAASSPLDAPAPVQRPTGTLMRIYSKPITQIVLLGLVCFLTAGFFNALSGIGGGGQVSADAANTANLALYSVFAVVSFFSGSILNRLGSRLTLFLGALGYCLYIISFLVYNIYANKGFVIAAGAILGVCASLLWVAQGSLMLSIPTESQKGQFIAVFWCIFNLGACLGSAIELGLTYHSTQNTVSNGVYASFVVLTGLGACCAMLLRDPAKMIRDDGTRVTVPRQTSWRTEFRGLFQLLVSDRWIVCLFPLFAASNFFYCYQFNDFNSPLFTLRTRALNSFLYWASQMGSSVAMGRLLDSRRMCRRSRAWVGWSVVFVLVWTVWGGSYAKQLQYTRADTQQPWWDARRIDFTQSRSYAGLCILYILMGVLDACFQTYAYYVIGTVSNDPAKLGFLAGFYKSFQSAGAAVAFAMDSKYEPFMTNLATGWALCAAGMVCALPVIALRVTNTTVEASPVGGVEGARNSESDVESARASTGGGGVVVATKEEDVSTPGSEKA
ncbi:uncharacterized protein PFL1_05431 [Pseudozyma flocculosa PF-1]|uniref:Related to DUF895 domain membrane protein n=2 Tax=Pseudozyma flocculosa TaxID=84751 RepID=A0A5C3FD40_9BASI|nr:uncharacterized protein PFL1_05431 [Pseudozyma flocculosa PF-1]EPQ27150.1 hypothetical protein PFL1_05431 [Pseudozyma flocculosa PF-1]SPO41269.1 related to DUF895 domain membrane protein [Pseudozyma flocculosa]